MTDLVDAPAVDLFDDWHRRGEGLATMTYRAPLPATPPGPGQQYRFEVDLDLCTGCKACVTACHSLNGLDEGETWRSVGLLIGSRPPEPTPSKLAVASRPDAVSEPAAPGPWQQHVTAACHHCLEPACLAGCPVEAYEKDPVTGIVAHLDDQCIGCRYCMLTCPYEVPTFNSRLGIVRKCDMCSDRLADGEAPACVQGCPTDAISIGLVNTAEHVAESVTDPAASLVPTAPRSSLTSPTTVYLSRRTPPADATAADSHDFVPAHDHPPLVAMLVLTQMSVAVFVLGRLVGTGSLPASMSWVAAIVAIGASVLHLGRPLMAWRAVLGLRHSWLSREIFAFGAYAPLAGVTAVADVGWVPSAWSVPLAVVTALVGIAGVGCSAQLYAVTGRPLWRLDRSMARFVLSGVATAAPAVALASAATGDHSDGRALAAMTVAATVMALLGAVTFVLRHRGGDALGRSVALMRGALLRRVRCSASAAMLAAVAALAAASTAGGASLWWWTSSSLAAFAAAWFERSLFFTAASPDRMPGGLR